jgi:hypothetical protein
MVLLASLAVNASSVAAQVYASTSTREASIGRRADRLAALHKTIAATTIIAALTRGNAAALFILVAAKIINAAPGAANTGAAVRHLRAAPPADAATGRGDFFAQRETMEKHAVLIIETLLVPAFAQWRRQRKDA